MRQRRDRENMRIDRAQCHFFDMAQGIGHDQTALRIRIPDTYPRAGFRGDHFIRDVRIFTHAIPHHAESRHRLHSRWLQQIHHLRMQNSQNDVTWNYTSYPDPTVDQREIYLSQICKAIFSIILIKLLHAKWSNGKFDRIVSPVEKGPAWIQRRPPPRIYPSTSRTCCPYSWYRHPPCRR